MTSENENRPEDEAVEDMDAAESAETPDEAANGEDGAPPDPDAVIAGLRDQLLRALADVDNTRKRAQRDVKETREYAVTGFARDMLDVADNLSRALASVDEDARASAGPALATLLEGVELTERRLVSTLERHGVRKIEPEPGEALDPNRHQAAAQIPADQPKGAIAHVMQPGYVIGDRTLRAAMVVVSSGPPSAAGAGEETFGAGQESGPKSGTGGVDVKA